jgi:type 1 fimbria pilin
MHGFFAEGQSATSAILLRGMGFMQRMKVRFTGKGCTPFGCIEENHRPSRPNARFFVLAGFLIAPFMAKANVAVNPPTIVVPSDAKPGDLLWQTTLNDGWICYSYYGDPPATVPVCTYGWQGGGWGQATSLGNSIATTNVAGIGARIIYTINGGQYSPTPGVPVAQPYYTGTYQSVTVQIYYLGGTIAPDARLSGNILILDNYPDRNGPRRFDQLFIGNAAPVVPGAPKTCEVATGDVNKVVKLNDAVISDFHGAGSTAKPTLFGLTVNNCSDTTVSASFDFRGTSAAENKMIFSNTGTATGVGVALYSSDDDKLIGADGTDSARTVPVTGNSVTLSLKAAYYQLAPNVRAGTVVSKATVDMTYN